MRQRCDKTERALQHSARLARSGFDIVTFAKKLVQQLRSVIPHSAACVITLDPTTGLLTGTYKFGGLADVHEQDNYWSQLEYGSDDPTRLALIAQRPTPAMAASHLPGGADESVRIRSLVRPGGYGDELRMVARQGDLSWGAVNLFRAVDEPSFTNAEARLLAALSEAVASGLRTGLMARTATASLAQPAAGPAVLIVGDDTVLKKVSVGADDLLAQITDQDHRSPAESIVQGLVTAAHEYASGRSSAIPRATLRCASGRWMVAQSAPLATDDRPSGEVVVTIDEARPPEIVSILALSYGLTAREREVTQLVLSGADTKGIADALSMSTYTVQDHLKAIFDKADVRSRRELMGRVFFEQYAPRLVDEVGPSGWFL